MHEFQSSQEETGGEGGPNKKRGLQWMVKEAQIKGEACIGLHSSEGPAREAEEVESTTA